MNRTLFSILVLFIMTVTSYAQQEIVDVTDQTIKIGAFKEEELYYGFASGDKIIFTFKEADNKELKELEIIEYPNNSKYSDYKTSSIDNKTISVTNKSVYIFRFKNSAITGRICKIKIQRIPASAETKDFNTTVTWETKQETSYNTYTKDVIVGYDTTYTQKTKKELVKTEISEQKIISETKVPISSKGWLEQNDNIKVVPITLPVNQISDYKTIKVTSWAYWVNVGNESIEKYNTTKTIMKGGASFVLSPLGAFAFGAVTDLVLPSGTEDVYSALTDATNMSLFKSNLNYSGYYYATSNGSFKKFTDPSMCKGTYYLCLRNDNTTFKIYVNIIVVAILETNIYEEKPYTDMSVKARYETKTFSDPVVRTYKVPVIGK